MTTIDPTSSPAPQGPAPAPALPLPPVAHVYGIGALLVAGFGVPAIWLISGADHLDKGDRWVLRGVATATALIAAPLAAFYLTRSTRQ